MIRGAISIITKCNTEDTTLRKWLSPPVLSYILQTETDNSRANTGDVRKRVFL